ncbi:MarR family winged helix-turn-helix transcriptional regulator [Microbacterium sp. SORGH_AS_0862]|uniref:MarR family winged helix-turn-helix transcriptional regulator n=1 Tax=Microbacterium sp. SORGH_AS_0862 TaxID=3041789 RepID=UPI002793BD35|nr:winged helix DNA-binding protein [Microbacterium sp. SORGH_AS_0862]MDQ1206699.1 DNA-binding MarR family transcriptional regulator [Microbacterium sp. SORGH_AS_0862]
MTPQADLDSQAAGSAAVDVRRENALADLADVVLSVARKIHAQTSEASDAIPLTPLEALAMQHIDRRPGLTSSEFAAELSLKSSNASAALRELERKGLIRRDPDPADRRTVRVTATARASENLLRVRHTWASLLSDIPADADRLATTTELLRSAERQLSERRYSRSSTH